MKCTNKVSEGFLKVSALLLKGLMQQQKEIHFSKLKEKRIN